MHEAVRDYVRKHLPAQYTSVLEVGSRDINGGVRDLLDPEAVYVGVDNQPGVGVDVVANFADYECPHPVDVVLCLEVLEHAPNWREIIASAAKNLKDGGTLILTCATEGRPPHSARSEDPISLDEYYLNVVQGCLDYELHKYFGSHESEVVDADLRAVAVANPVKRWNVLIPSRSDRKIKARFREIQKTHPWISRDRIVVISDGLSRRTRKTLHGVRWVEGQKPFVFARAINAGVKAAEPDADIVILGDDVRFETPNAIWELCRASKGESVVVPEVVGVCGQPAQRHGATNTTACWVAFICAYIPRKVWDAVGGLDERFIGYGYDDVDWCRRAAGHGEIRIAHDVTVNHLHESSFRTQPNFHEKYQTNRMIYLDKWGARA